MKREEPKKHKPGDKAQQAAEAFTEPSSRQIDPLGSYTGRPAQGDKPVQDADDL